MLRMPRFLFAGRLAGSILFASIPPAHAQRQMEALGRGVVAMRQDDGRVHVSWRLLGTDPDEIAFNVYRAAGSGVGATVTRLTASPHLQTTDLIDSTAPSAGPLTYFVRPVLGGVELESSSEFTIGANAPIRPYLSIPLIPPPNGTTPDNLGFSYTANDCSAADLDGDGEYELIVKWDPTNSKDNSQSGFTGNVFIDGYKLDGTRLWRIDLGRNIRAGAHYTQFMVYDLDGDGRAELACKTADGTRDSTGQVIGDPTADHRNSSGYILRGPEFLTLFDGLTGRTLATTRYVPARNSDPASEDVSAWGDNYGNRVDRFLAAVAYLDGRRPSLVMCRGYYTRTALVAWDWRDGQLAQRWRFDTRSDLNPRSVAPGYAGWEEMGNHQLSIADVDDDGRDEIIYGAIAIDDDGRGLYTTRLGHGDALHVSDLDPDRPGLEVYGPHESPALYGANGSEMHDARTGAILWGVSGQGSDVGRGVAFDIDPRHRGYEAWSARGGLYNARGELITDARPSQMNFGIWWDADPLRELLDGTTISKWDWTTNRANTVFTATGAASNNGTKATPALTADLLGDWREEVVFRSGDSREVRIYVSPVPATNRLPTLMHDPQYRLAVAWQNVAYNQPPHPGFFLGDGMTRPPTPLIRTVPQPGRLANLSVRTAAGDAADTLIVGFAISANGGQTLLLRGIGPALSAFGVSGAMLDPQLNLFSGSTLIASNNDWYADVAADDIARTAANLGAFPLPRSSRDAAFVRTLGSGSYTVHLTPASGGSAGRGVALVELYASAAANGGRVANVSARAQSASGADTLVAGFVVETATTRTVLVRGIGPGLSQFGVSGAANNPQLTLFRGDARIAANDDWQRDSGATAAAFSQLGAFGLPPASKDAALLLNLPAGSYTVHATNADNTGGVVLIEVYDVY